MIIITAIIAPVTIIIISVDFCFKIVYDIANLILAHFYQFQNTANRYQILNMR